MAHRAGFKSCTAYNEEMTGLTLNKSGSTIAALATAPAPAGLAVIRVSGSGCRKLLPLFFRGNKDPLTRPREMIYGEILNPTDSELLDHGMVVFMKSPASFTGEDVIEFHLHGSPLLARQLLKALYTQGVQPAVPGEFSQRAFLAGKMDLLQVEALSEIIHANSERALRVAQRQLKGSLSKIVDQVGEPLRDVLAEIEASVDFPEEDIEPEKIATISKTISKCREQLARLLETSSYGDVLRDGFRVLICGLPNAGKSSLLNLLVGEERAIVSDISGTTRDLIEVNSQIEGLKMIFCDTAGIRETDDSVEQIGVRLARDRIQWADHILLVVDSANPEQYQFLLAELLSAEARFSLIWNKADLVKPEKIEDLDSDSQLLISTKNGDGIETLRATLVKIVEHYLPDQADSGEIVVQERQQLCLRAGIEALEKVEQAVFDHLPLEFISAELRIALRNIEELIGKTYTEDILGRIFSKFCIGK